MAVNRKCQCAHFKQQGLRNWLNNQFGYEQNFKHRNNLLTPPKGAAHWMFHSVCLTSGLQRREIITPPKLDLWETAVSRLCHSDKMFYYLGWISFLAEGPCVQAGRWMRGCRLRGGRETISRVLYGNRSWKHKRQILGTHPLISYRLPSLDCVSTPPWIRCVSLLAFLKFVWEISSLTQMSKTLFHSLFWVDLILNPVSYPTHQAKHSFSAIVEPSLFLGMCRGLGGANCNSKKALGMGHGPSVDSGYQGNICCVVPMVSLGLVAQLLLYHP